MIIAKDLSHRLTPQWILDINQQKQANNKSDNNYDKNNSASPSGSPIRAAVRYEKILKIWSSDLAGGSADLE